MRDETTERLERVGKRLLERADKLLEPKYRHYVGESRACGPSLDSVRAAAEIVVAATSCLAEARARGGVPQ